MKSKYGDPRKLTFSQAQGYEKLPQKLKLGEFPRSARTRIWNVLFPKLWSEDYGVRIMDPLWSSILRDVHSNLHNLPLDIWRESRAPDVLRHIVWEGLINEVFDLIGFILRHSDCPTEVVDEMKEAFEKGMVAYIIDDSGPPTIFPACTEAEGQSLVEALNTLQQGGLSVAAGLLREASTDINRGDWAGSIKNSIDAAESVARTLEPGAQTFGEALRDLRRSPALWHPQLVRAMENIWTYTNQAVRHGSPEPTDEYVGLEEALFMLGTCAAVASYLWRKHSAGEKS